MGQGEPLVNLPSVAAAYHLLTRGLGLSGRAVTVSTVGVPNTIRRLAAMALPVTLAVSIHAPNQVGGGRGRAGGGGGRAAVGGDRRKPFAPLLTPLPPPLPPPRPRAGAARAAHPQRQGVPHPGAHAGARGARAPAPAPARGKRAGSPAPSAPPPPHRGTPPRAPPQDCAAYFRATKRRVTFEYTLLAGVNDGAHHVRGGAGRAGGGGCGCRLRCLRRGPPRACGRPRGRGGGARGPRAPTRRAARPRPPAGARARGAAAERRHGGARQRHPLARARARAGLLSAHAHASPPFPPPPAPAPLTLPLTLPPCRPSPKEPGV